MKKSCDMSQLNLSQDIATDNVKESQIIIMVTLDENVQARIDPKEEKFRVFHELTNCIMQKLQSSLVK